MNGGPACEAVRGMVARASRYHPGKAMEAPMPAPDRTLFRPLVLVCLPLLLLTLGACRAPVLAGSEISSAAPANSDAQVPASVVLAAGEDADLGSGRKLKFLRVQNDSRCPKDVQCVWAGEVTLAFELRTAEGSSSFQLSTSTAKSASASWLDFELRDYSPCPASPKRAAGSECATVGMRAIAVR